MKRVFQILLLPAIITDAHGTSGFKARVHNNDGFLPTDLACFDGNKKTSVLGVTDCKLKEAIGEGLAFVIINPEIINPADLVTDVEFTADATETYDSSKKYYFAVLSWTGGGALQ